MQMAQPAQLAPLHYVGTVLAAHNSLDAAPAHCPQPLSKTSVEDSDWEPDGVTHHVRFCEGPGTTVVWLKYGGTAGKPGGKRRKQTSTCSSWRTRSTHQGQVKRKHTSPGKKVSFFAWPQRLHQHGLVSIPPRTRYFCLIGSGQ